LLAYPLVGPDRPLPHGRNWYYVMERRGLIKLLRIGGRTLISAEDVDGILSGRIKPPDHVSRKHRPTPKNPRKGRPRKAGGPKRA
jgi:hypothetical protein